MKAGAFVPAGRRGAGLASALAVAAAALAAGTAASAEGPAAERTPRVKAGEVIVAYERGSAPDDRAAALTATGAEPGHRMLLPRTRVVEVEPGTEAGTAAALELEPGVLFAEPNGIVHAASLPSDPRLAEQWPLANRGGVGAVADADIDGSEAWWTARGIAGGPALAIIDTGIATGHPEFAGALYTNPGETGGGAESNGIDDDGNGLTDDYRGWNFIVGDNDPEDDNGHGTHMAGIAAARANDGTGIAGVAAMPGAGRWSGPPILPVKVLNRNGTGSFESIAEGLAYAGEQGAAVANVSIGTSGTSAVIDAAIQSHPETLYVIAAGNDSTNTDTGPGTAPCVQVVRQPDAPNKLCVASTDAADNLAASSNYGATNVDIAAPGVAVLSAWPQTIVYEDRFEGAVGPSGAPAGWVTDDPGQTGPRWGISDIYSASPSHSLADSPGGTIFDPVPYVAGQDNWARTADAIDLRGGRDCRLDASLTMETQLNGDHLTYEATTTPADGSSWRTFATWTGTFTERVGQRIPAEIEAAGEAFVRLRLRANGSIEDDGAYADDVRMVCWGTYNQSSYEAHSGTSVAAPHVAGAAALLFAEHPGATVARVKEMIMRSVDPKPALTGKVASGGRLNVYKAAAESSVARSGGTLTFTAGAGERNDVVVTPVTGPGGEPAFRITDSYTTTAAGEQGGSRLLPGTGCVRLTDTIARCGAGAVKRIVINLGDLGDRARVAGVRVAAELNGGSGPDRLVGGAAADRFRGGADNDSIAARSGDADAMIDCGESAGDADIAVTDASLDRAALRAGCERVLAG